MSRRVYFLDNVQIMFQETFFSVATSASLWDFLAAIGARVAERS